MINCVLLILSIYLLYFNVIKFGEIQKLHNLRENIIDFPSLCRTYIYIRVLEENGKRYKFQSMSPGDSH